MTNTPAVTVADVVNSASDLLQEVEDGTLNPADVQGRAVSACRSLFGIVGAGPADPLWELHGDVCRQYLERGGLTSAEIREWLAVQRRREGMDVSSDMSAEAAVSSAPSPAPSPASDVLSDVLLPE